MTINVALCIFILLVAHAIIIIVYKNNYVSINKWQIMYVNGIKSKNNIYIYINYYQYLYVVIIFV